MTNDCILLTVQFVGLTTTYSGHEIRITLDFLFKN